jgi:hypothetical protein
MFVPNTCAATYYFLTVLKTGRAWNVETMAPTIPVSAVAIMRLTSIFFY